jgi:hypothetical protein
MFIVAYIVKKMSRRGEGMRFLAVANHAFGQEALGLMAEFLRAPIAERGRHRGSLWWSLLSKLLLG